MCPYATEKEKKKIKNKVQSSPLLHWMREEKEMFLSFTFKCFANTFHHWVIQVTFSRAVFPTKEQATGRKLLHLNLKE